MSDYVKREDAINAMAKAIGHIVYDAEPISARVMNAIPSADVVEVVRCKECKWSKANGTYQWCGRLDSTARITADDFCSYGEREGE